jgi:hypothetical protein
MGSGSNLPLVRFLEPLLYGDGVTYEFDDSGLGGER